MIKYCALGDSYTIGEGAKPEEAWPNILVQTLQNNNIEIELVANPSITGWTTQDLIDKELPLFDLSNADFITLLIGVNDWVQEVSIEQFTTNLKLILDHVQERLKVKSNILLVTIPDFGVTPKGEQYSKGRNISEGLSEFNNIIKYEASLRKLECVDIFPISKRAKNELDLVSDDGVHGSSKMYALWEKIISPYAIKVLN